MGGDAERIRNGALSILTDKGMKWSRIGSGQRFLVEIVDGHKTKRALVKTASKGGAMVFASSVNKNADISGFDDDFDEVLFCVGDPDTDFLAAYLVPAHEAEEAYRSESRHSKRAAGGAMWIIGFYGAGDKPWNGFAEKWRKYLIGAKDDVIGPTAGPAARERPRARTPRMPSAVPHFATIAEVMAWAREQLAEIAHVRVEAVKLDMKIEY